MVIQPKFYSVVTVLLWASTTWGEILTSHPVKCCVSSQTPQQYFVSATHNSFVAHIHNIILCIRNPQHILAICVRLEHLALRVYHFVVHIHNIYCFTILRNLPLLTHSCRRFLIIHICTCAKQFGLFLYRK